MSALRIVFSLFVFEVATIFFTCRAYADDALPRFYTETRDFYVSMCKARGRDQDLEAKLCIPGKSECVETIGPYPRAKSMSDCVAEAMKPEMKAAWMKDSLNPLKR